jgi:hypothetical protein
VLTATNDDRVGKAGTQLSDKHFRQRPEVREHHADADHSRVAVDAIDDLFDRKSVDVVVFAKT